MNQVILTEDQCLDIMKEYNMLENIVLHSIQVKNIALALWCNLTEKKSVNKELVVAGALLHDIAKTWSIQTGEKRHDSKGAEILREINLPEIAYIVESHVFFDNFHEDGPIEERELVFYADKRVKHDQIVSLEDRVEDLIIRYGKTEEIVT
jgi:uncharacterized protein